MHLQLKPFYQARIEDCCLVPYQKANKQNKNQPTFMLGSGYPNFFDIFES